MSELFEALKKIEKNKTEGKADIPDFAKRKVDKKPYLLIFASIFFVAFVVFWGLYFVNLYKNKKAARSLSVATHLKKNSHIKHYSQINNNKISNNTKQEIRTTETSIGEKNVKVAEKQVSKGKTQLIKSKKTGPKRASKQHLVKRVVEEKVRASSIATKTKVTKSSKIKRSDFISTTQLVQQANSGDFNESVHAYELLLKRFPTNISLYNNLAAELMKKGFYKKAKAILKKALKIRQDSTIKLNLAICYIKLGKLKKAKALINTIRPDESNEEILNNLKTYLFQLNSP